jgi:hypothetical protein
MECLPNLQFGDYLKTKIKRKSKKRPKPHKREEPDEQPHQQQPVRQRPECCHRVPHLDDIDDGISNERSDEPLLGRHRQHQHHQQNQQFNSQHYYYNWDVSEDSGNVTNSSTENQSSTSGGNQAQNHHRRANKAFSYNVTYDDLWDGRSFIRHLPNIDGQTFSEADEGRLAKLRAAFPAKGFT